MFLCIQLLLSYLITSSLAACRLSSFLSVVGSSSLKDVDNIIHDISSRGYLAVAGTGRISG
jgi:hypothetical protein